MASLVCSGNFRFYDLQNFTLETCSEKPEVDIMMPSLASDAQVIQWQSNKKTVIFLRQIGEILQKPCLVNYPLPVAGVRVKKFGKLRPEIVVD